MRNRTVAIERQTAGVALLTALGLLFIFMVLGMGYVTYSINEADSSNYSLKDLRAHEMARGGVEAAIGELQKSLAAAGPAALIQDGIKMDSFPQYGPNRKAPEGFSLREQWRASVGVTIQDESGKINLNYAPPSVLQALLGVDGDTARRIRSSVAVQDGGGRMIVLDDLVVRKLVNAEVYAKLPLTELSVTNVADPAQVAETLNINAAKPDVLAAVFGMTLDEATKAFDGKRPFATLADAVAATGKDPALYNLKPAADTPGAIPVELSLQSRSFRIVSNASLAESGREMKARVEAVVVFTKDGTVRVTYWSELPEKVQASQEKTAQ